MNNKNIHKNTEVDHNLKNALKNLKFLTYEKFNIFFNFIHGFQPDK